MDYRVLADDLDHFLTVGVGATLCCEGECHFLSKNAVYNQKLINQYCLVSDGCDYVLLTYGGCRYWFQRFGCRYFTKEDLSIEFDIGEESGEVIGDVNGVISYYRETDASEVMTIVSFSTKVLWVSVGS